MKSAVSKLREAAARLRRFEPNPVLVKELRQAVRNRLVASALMFFLVALFLVGLGMMISEVGGYEDKYTRLGYQMFQAFFWILAGISAMFVPYYVGGRMVSERDVSNLDLLYTTALTPGQIIRGKFMAGAYLALLFLSVCMPFMVFTVLLRGVDLPRIFSSLAFLYLFVCTAVMAALFVSSLPAGKALKIAFAVLFVWFGLGTFTPYVVMSMVGMSSGSGTGSTGWLETITLIVSGVGFFGLLYVLAVVLISPIAANRALPVRAYATGLWLVLGGLSIIWMLRESSSAMLVPWAVGTYLLMIPGLLVIISQRDRLSWRVRMSIPTSEAKRALAFLFYNGAAGGLLWAACILSVTFIVLFLCSLLVPPGPGTWLDGQLPTLYRRWGSVLAYTFAYVLTGLFIHRRFTPQLTPKLAGIFAVCVYMAAVLVPYLGLLVVHGLRWDVLDVWVPGNIMDALFCEKPGHVDRHLVLSLVWLVTALVLNLGWFVRQAREFRHGVPSVDRVTAPAPPIIKQPAA